MFGIDREGNPHHGPQVDGLSRLKADGSTASGCWIYSGVLGPERLTRRTHVIRKIILATAGGSSGRPIAELYIIERAPPTGEPWSERKKLVWWDRAQKQMDRHRCP